MVLYAAEGFCVGSGRVPSIHVPSPTCVFCTWSDMVGRLVQGRRGRLNPRWSRAMVHAWIVLGPDSVDDHVPHGHGFRIPNESLLERDPQSGAPGSPRGVCCGSGRDTTRTLSRVATGAAGRAKPTSLGRIATPLTRSSVPVHRGAGRRA